MATSFTKESPSKRQTKTTAAPITLTVAQLDNTEIITTTAVALTLPSADVVVAYIASLHLGQVMTNESYEFDVRNTAASGSTTLVLPADVTLATGSSGSIPPGNVSHFNLRISLDNVVPGTAQAILTSYAFAPGPSGTLIVDQIGTCALPVHQEFVYGPTAVANTGIVIQADATACTNTTRLVTAAAGGHVYKATFPDVAVDGTVVLDNAAQTITRKTITDSTNTVRATILGTATTDVVINGAAAPALGYQLIAASGVAANWLQTSGQYAPAYTALSGGFSAVTNPAGQQYLWSRAGSIVTVRGLTTITQTGAGTDSFQMSVPIPPVSNFANAYQAQGAVQPVLLCLANEYGSNVAANAATINVIVSIVTLTNALTGIHNIAFMYSLV